MFLIQQQNLIKIHLFVVYLKLLLNYLIENFIGLKERVRERNSFILFSFVISDISVKLDGETLYGHRFILAARSVKWDPQQLGDTADLDLSGKNIDL